MSRVVRFHRVGGPDVLEIEDIPDRDLKQGELRVRIEAIGINRAEEMSALLGTQPKLRQSPPIKLRSISATRPPSPAVPAAVTRPAVPAPITATL